MKRVLILIALTVMVIVGVMGDSKFVGLPQHLEEKAYDILIKRHVHKDYIVEFQFQIQTNNWYDMTLEFIALGYTESNWVYFKSPKNTNGSRDVGPMGLNTYNIANEDFMIKHKPISGSLYIEGSYQYYMAVCMSYYKWISDDIGKDAFMAYNGGRSRYFNGTLPQMSYDHQKKSIWYLKELEKRFQIVMKEVIDEEIEQMYSFNVQEYIDIVKLSNQSKYDNYIDQTLFFKRNEVMIVLIV